MAIQLYYHPDLTASAVTLSPEESEHCLRAMRHRAGDEIHITDGKGTLAIGSIVSDRPKCCVIELQERQEHYGARARHFHLAVAPTKNTDRMEWMLEKCIEVGVEKISFILCDHSERPRMNMPRMQRIAIAAIKQSCTTILPEMECLPFSTFIDREMHTSADKCMAWCDHDNTLQLASVPLKCSDMILLVGPEGDFSRAEIDYARDANYTDIKLGNRRLRTETAALYGCITFDIRCNVLQ